MEVQVQSTPLRELLSTSNLIREVIANEEDFSPEILQKLALTAADNQFALSQKVDAIAFVLDDLESMAAQMKARADMNNVAAKKFKSAHDRLKEYLKGSMIAFNMEEIEGTDERFKLSDCAMSLIISDVNSLPKKFVNEIVVKEPIKDAIKAALENLEEVPGARIEGGKSLRRYAVKPKGKKK